MTRSAVVAGTPYYVLMDGSHRIGPKLLEPLSGIDSTPVYGFSGRGAYGTFCTNCQRALTPYPLVAVYLREQACVPGGSAKLVVLDAAGPREQCLHAATVEAVLEAHEKRTSHLSATRRLTFDREADAYRVEETSV